MSSLDSFLASNPEQIRLPSEYDDIHKEECALTFASPLSEDGIYIDMVSHIGYGINAVQQNYAATQHAVYLHIKRTRKKLSDVPSPSNTLMTDKDTSEPSPKRLAIPATPVEEFEETTRICLLPQFEYFPLASDDIPDECVMVAAAIISADSSTRKAEVAEWVGDVYSVSKYSSSLIQVESPPAISPSGWKCMDCDKTENLWLNLSDGFIACGRKNWDGSGGNGHALIHFEATGNIYPLCVKLGTITPDGKADVYSYASDENDMVEDPLLDLHLQHFGINMSALRKTEKTVAELDLEANLKHEFSRITEAGKELVSLYGPGFTGLKNLGNSCYMNSIMQVIFSLPDFQDHYAGASGCSILERVVANPTTDLSIQLAKLGVALCSGEYSKQPPEDANVHPDDIGIAPRMFKTLIGRSRADFATAHQQDALDYFQFILSSIEREEKRINTSRTSTPKVCFGMVVEERREWTDSGKVCYKKHDDNVLTLHANIEEDSINYDDVAAYKARGDKEEEQVIPEIPLNRLLQRWAAASDLDLGSSLVKRTTHIATFPRVLVFAIGKFYMEGWGIPKKLDMFVDAPEELNLEWLRGHGLQPGEEEKHDDVENNQKNGDIEIDESIVASLVAMGFPSEGCRRAVWKTNNHDVESAMEWVLTHMEDPDFCDPIPTSNNTEDVYDEEAAVTLISMGFTLEQAKRALKATQNNITRAMDWIFSHADDSIEIDNDPCTNTDVTLSAPTSSTFRLLGFVSHMGSSAACGHYVAHIKKNGKWVLFNDEKVAESITVPKECGYLYFYERV